MLLGDFAPDYDECTRRTASGLHAPQERPGVSPDALRGIVVGLLLSVPLWALLGGIGYLVSWLTTL